MKHNQPYRWPPRTEARRLGIAKNMLAIGLIGDGIVALVWPQRQLRLWKAGPRPYQRLTQAVMDRPLLVRLTGATELVVGLWWNHRIYEAHNA